MALKERSGSAVRIEIISSEETIALRHSVLWPDMPREHVILPEDAQGIHYGAFSSNTSSPVAVVSLFLEPQPDVEKEGKGPGLETDGASPQTTARHAVRFRKFACDPKYQGKGIGTQLLLHALSMARSDMGVVIAWCDARKATEEWYMKRGFVAFGGTFFKGSVEYVRMKLDLAKLRDKS